MRSRDTMNRTFKRRMGQLLQAMFKRDFPGDIEGRAHQPRTKLIRGLARHTDSSCCIGDGCGPRQRRQKGTHLLTSPLVVPFRAGADARCLRAVLAGEALAGRAFGFALLITRCITYMVTCRTAKKNKWQSEGVQAAVFAVCRAEIGRAHV